MRPIPKRMRTRKGQALIEFSLVLPLLFLLIVNVINFGAMMYAWICVSNASRAGSGATDGPENTTLRI